RYGRRIFMVWGLILFALSMYFYDWIGGIAALMVLRVFHGASWAFSTTAIGTAITDIIPPARRGEGLGWFGMAMTVAMAIGPMLGIWVLQHYSFRGMFLFGATLSVVALLLTVLIRTSYQPKAAAKRIELFEKS